MLLGFRPDSLARAHSEGYETARTASEVQRDDSPRAQKCAALQTGLQLCERADV